MPPNRHSFTDPGEFAPIIGPLAKHFFGEPNRAFSSDSEWRYGTKGSLSIDVTAGRWFDHEANEGGGVLDLVERELKLKGPGPARMVETTRLPS